jgi:hypothetical protein
MYLKSFRIKNYKSFDDSLTHILTPGFNVILGQNNAGKTAVIEALSFFSKGARPHCESSQNRFDPLPPDGSVELQIFIPKEQLYQAIIRENPINIPLPQHINVDGMAQQFVNNFFNDDQYFSINMKVMAIVHRHILLTIYLYLQIKIKFILQPSIAFHIRLIIVLKRLELAKQTLIRIKLDILLEKTYFLSRQNELA